MTENTDDSPDEEPMSDHTEFVPLETTPETDLSPRPYTVPRPPCDGCEIEHHTGLTDVELGENTFSVCDECIRHLTDSIERFYWYDRLTEAHYDRAADYLRSLDEVWCVHADTYALGEIRVHTPYCDAGIVNDVCDHFGFNIYWFSIVEPAEHEMDCFDEHGPCVEICLDYPSHVTNPLPLENDIMDKLYSDTEWLTEEKKLFHNEC